MLSTRNKLYTFLLMACLTGYGWILYHAVSSPVPKTEVCLFRHITRVPCPSCGSTRSVFALLHGNLSQAWLINPFGFVLAVLMTIVPVWILADLATRRNSLFNVYNRAETVFKKPGIAVSLILLVLINWIWNIAKGL